MASLLRDITPHLLPTMYLFFLISLPNMGSLGFPVGSVVKNLSINSRDAGLIPESERAPGEGNGNPLQYSWLGNPMDRGA